eukprot:TRINITY_DN3442_c0_g1_i2.p1 TRINITY_DN3442_c0_g1~~TRINITY_DN3442_c0_g1_i2.p1  ORF type:complete len:479 (+),score=94.33 TRINITY_DN3442_c0_g1_i2:39-1475(+)
MPSFRATVLLLLSFFSVITAQNTDPPTEATVPTINTGDTAWILCSTALVMLMTPGLSLFYGGMVSRANVINTLMLSVVTMGVITVEWVLFGYSLAFAPGTPGMGDFRWGGLKDVKAYEPNTDYAPTIPHLLFSMYQLMFAIVTPAIISGAVVGRMKFVTWIIFVFIWHIVVYDLIAHLVWGIWTETKIVNGIEESVIRYGWLKERGAIDFAGGTVVHISSGVSGLVAAILVGKRSKGSKEDIAFRAWNIPFTVLGACLLWFGWFGFNAGSALGANGLAAVAFANTTIAAGSGFLTWILIDGIIYRKATAIGASSGAVVGLVAITPAAGFVVPGFAILFGLVSVAFAYLAVRIKKKISLDDSLDAFSCHGVGGIVGAFMTGLFATKEVNEYGANGAFYGNPKLLGEQVLAIVIAAIISGGLTALILLSLKFIPFLGLRVLKVEEEVGLDEKYHGERVNVSVRNVELEDMGETGKVKSLD